MKKNWFKYAVIGVILLIPFMYSFFYLKAYWDPYGSGNMDNIPVAIVNLDEGKKGSDFASNLIESKKLKFDLVSEKEADDGVYNKKYYAVIKIPKNFTECLESAGENDKVPATITYSPNQKTNYLASQIISRVLVVAEEKTRDEVSKTVVKGLVEKLNEVPEKMVSLSDGIEKIQNGSNELNNGISTLNDKYQEFNSGIEKLYDGSTTLSNGINDINNGTSALKEGSDKLNSGIKEINEALDNTDLSKINDLVSGINEINVGTSNLSSGINNYVDGTNSIAGGVLSLDKKLDDMINYYTGLLNTTTDIQTTIQIQSTIGTLKSIKQSINDSNLVGGASLILSKGDELKNGANLLNNGTNMLYESTSDISNLGVGINTLKENLKKVEYGSNSLNDGISKLNDGTNRISVGASSLNSGMSNVKDGSIKINSALSEIKNGSGKLNDGISTLKDTVDDSIDNSKNELSKLEGLDDFVENSVTINEEPINVINSYGTAFGPFFMSIALWVGSLMLFIILYYDKNNRFKLLGESVDNKLLRTMCYLGLASLQGIALGILLMIGLDFSITNYLLYFVALILVSCLFESIMEFLIVNFKDVGKFLALILLVLQLAAAGGTFPIETVTKCFRFLNPLLPMKYTCDLFKETIISIEGNLLGKSLIVIVILFVVLLGFNIYKDMKKEDI